MLCRSRRLREGQQNLKRSSLSHPAFHGYGAAMTFYNILYNKKSQAKSRRDGTAGFRPVKTVPDFIQLIFRNTNAVVFHTDADICAALLQRNTDISAGMPVLDTIVDQIDKETGEKLGISPA